MFHHHSLTNTPLLAALLLRTAAHDNQTAKLYAQIGRLTTQLSWIKNIWPRP